MVTNCANPKCFLPFKYLREGRLFRLRLHSVTEMGGRKTRVEYFWLCAFCSSEFTLIFDERQGVSLAPFGDERDYREMVTLIFDISPLRSPAHRAEPEGASKDGSRRTNRECRAGS